jgi:hypothetical protein
MIDWGVPLHLAQVGADSCLRYTHPAKQPEALWAGCTGDALGHEQRLAVIVRVPGRLRKARVREVQAAGGPVTAPVLVPGLQNLEARGAALLGLRGVRLHGPDAKEKVDGNRRRVARGDHTARQILPVHDGGCQGRAAKVVQRAFPNDVDGA